MTSDLSSQQSGTPLHGDSTTAVRRRPGLPRKGRGEVLDQLALVAELLRMAQADYDRLIDKAIKQGHSERTIAKAAGISGPAIHHRKTRKEQ